MSSQIMKGKLQGLKPQTFVCVLKLYALKLICFNPSGI